MKVTASSAACLRLRSHPALVPSSCCCLLTPLSIRSRTRCRGPGKSASTSKHMFLFKIILNAKTIILLSCVAINSNVLAMLVCWPQRSSELLRKSSPCQVHSQEAELILTQIQLKPGCDHKHCKSLTWRNSAPLLMLMPATPGIAKAQAPSL